LASLPLHDALPISYPNSVADFLKERGIQAGIHEISGSVEIAPGIGLAEAVCDLVSSGSTLLSNGLREVEVVMQSEAVLVANSDCMTTSTSRRPLLDRKSTRLNSSHVKNSYAVF